MTAENRMVGPDGHVDVDFLADLAEGLLDAVQAGAVHAHLDGCPDCRETFAALGELPGLLGSRPAEPMPDDVFDGLMAVLAETARADAAAADGTPDTPSDSDASRDTAPHRPLTVAPDLGALPPPAPRRVPSTNAEHSPGTFVKSPSESPSESAAAPVVPLDSVRRGRRRGWLVAASVAVAVAIGGTLIGVLGDSGSERMSNGKGASAPNAVAQSGGGNSQQEKADTALPPAGPSNASPGSGVGSLSQPSTSSTDYRRADLPRQVASLLTRQVHRTSSGAAGETASTGSTTSGSTGKSPPTESTAAPSRTPDAALAATLPQCVLAVGGGRLPLAAETALFEGQPAHIVVFPGNTAGVADVFAISSTSCSSAFMSSGSSAPATADRSKIIYSTTVPLP